MPVKKKAVSAKAAPKTDVIVAPSTALTKPGSWREYAKQAIVVRKAEQEKLSSSGGNYISFKGGVTTIGGVKVSNPFPSIILATRWQRSYFANAYSPDVSATPDCFSFDKQRPHADSPVPQSDVCAQCRFNEFGSSTNGKGKACQEGTRIAILAGDVLKRPETIVTAPIAIGKMSFLNGQTYRNFAGAVFDADDMPEFAFLTMISNQYDERSQYALSFEAREIPEDDAVLDALAARAAEAVKLLEAPYKAIEEAPAKTAAPARRRKF